MVEGSESGEFDAGLLEGRALLLASETPGLSSRAQRAAEGLQACPEKLLVAGCAAAERAIILTMPIRWPFLKRTEGVAAVMLMGAAETGSMALEFERDQLFR